MKIRSFGSKKGKALKRLYLDDDPKGFSVDVVPKIRTILFFLQDMTNVESLFTVPPWRAHKLSGDRAGTWSLRVTGNTRLTFRVEQEEIYEVDYEDYH